MRTRQYILEATEQMLQSKGLARVTNKEIAKLAGCAEGTLYKHFETKEDLILSAIQEHLPDFLAVVQEERIGKNSIEENLQEIAHALIRYYVKVIPLFTSLFADMEIMGRFRQWMQEQQRGPIKIYERVAAYIEAEQRIGRLNQALEPFNFGALLVGACFQYAFIQYFQGLDPFPASEEQFTKGLVRNLMAGGEPQKELPDK